MGKRKPRHLEKSTNEETTSGIKVPTFDEKTLSALKSRIEKELEDQNLSLSQRRDVETPTPESQKRSNKSETGNPHPKKKIRVSCELTRKNFENVTNSQNTGQGTDEKRHSQSHKAESDRDSKKVLLNEILELGGTKEDYDLIENIVSDSENEVGKPSKSLPPINKSFQKELASFIADLELHTAARKEKNEPFLSNLSAIEAERGSLSRSTKVTEKLNSTVTSQSSNFSSKTTAPGPEKLIFQARPDWHAISLPSLPTHKVNNFELYSSAVQSLKEYALCLLEAENHLYASKNLSPSSSQKFLSTIMISGTLSDKISALTLVIQESPAHTTKSFESLVGLAKKRSRGQAITALAALKDLLGTGAVLPSNRRLRSFANQPGLLGTLSDFSIYNWNIGESLPGNISKAHLIYWAYEDWLKQSYFDVLKILEIWCSDEVEYARSRAVTYVFELLRDKPEQESNLLRLLVNKLGDASKKIASKTSYLILQLQASHPLMKPIIIESIESEILLRPGQSLHAKYYAITTLNQTILYLKENELAKNLLRIYFELFVALLKKSRTSQSTEIPVASLSHMRDMQGNSNLSRKKSKAQASCKQQPKKTNSEVDEKLISAILTGINRAFPFSKSDDNSLESQMDTLFKITHSSNFNTSIQALLLIEQLATTKSLCVDRFYRTLYESLLDPRLITSSKHALYLNLLYRSLRSDLDEVRVKSFIKRMMQILTLHQPPFICGILYLINELEMKFPGIRFLLTEPEENDLEEKFYDVPDDGDNTQLHKSTQNSSCSIKYDGKKRDPRHSNVSKSCLWELIPFIAHFHPSVSLFANCFLDNAKMPPKPDLASHTLSSFLDRFVYRNAKAKSSQPKGTSIMQPLAGSDHKSVFLSNRSIDSLQEPLNSESFWRKKTEDVSADEVFFHKYFNQIGKTKQSKNSSLKEAKFHFSDNDDSEDAILEALVKSNPNIEGSDSDFEMSDIDNSDNESSYGEPQSDDQSEKEDPINTFSDPEEDITGLSNSDPEIKNLFEHELMASEQEDPENAKSKKRKRIRMKDLPLFASVDDYAAILDKERDEEL